MTIEKRKIRSWEEIVMQFENSASIYNDFSSQYPDILFDQIQHLTNIKPGDHLLEIGSGSGRATKKFSERRFKIECIEPGSKLVSLAKKSVEHNPHITFFNGIFEEWPVRVHSFDMVFSAQSFHWVDKAIKYQRVADALKDEKYLSLFWNIHFNNGSEQMNALTSLCKSYDVLTLMTSTQMEAEIQYNLSEITESNLFTNPVVYTFPWSSNETPQHFINFLNTGYGYQDLTKSSKRELDKRIHKIFDESGGIINREIISVLYLCSKKSS